MAGQFPYSNASGQLILKSILDKLQITISQLEKETGLSYSSLQRIYNGETKKITMPVYSALKERYPTMRDEFLKDATFPIFDDDEDVTEENNIDIIYILRDARKILDACIERQQYLSDLEVRLIKRTEELDERAKNLDAIMKAFIDSQSAKEQN